MSNIIVPETSANDTPASKMAKINQDRTLNSKFKTLNRLTSMSFIDKNAEEGVFFPGSQMVEGEPDSSFNFQMRSIEPKLLHTSSSKLAKDQKVSLRNADLKKLNKIHKSCSKLNLTHFNANSFKNTHYEDVPLGDDGNNGGECSLPSIPEDPGLYFRIQASYKSTFGFLMKTKKLRTKSAILDDGGFDIQKNL